MSVRQPAQLLLTSLFIYGIYQAYWVETKCLGKVKNEKIKKALNVF